MKHTIKPIFAIDARNRNHRNDWDSDERSFVHTLLREARENCDPHYAISAAGFWLEHLAPRETKTAA